MKNTMFVQMGRALIAGFCIATVVVPQSARACMGSAGPVCVVNPAACLKSMVLAKAAPTVVVFPPGGPALFNVPMNLFITCPTNNNCGNSCPNPGVGVPLTPSSITVNLYPGPCPPGALPPVPAATASISTAAGTMAAPVCSSGGAFNAYNVGVTVPVGTPPGLYCVVGTATVTFPDGTVLTQTGDTVVCIVEPAPGRPGVPRLGLQLLSPPVVRAAPGDPATVTYRILNNDPSNSVVVVPSANSRQAAVRPQGGNETRGIFAISSPFGDDFPIQFNPGGNCIPLPGHPYTQGEISGPPITIPPGGSNTITVGIRSYGQCASGSCSESTLRVQGTFANGAPALACAGMALIVDAGMPSTTCARAVNDCNQNGIPDALDISSRRSADQNFNALPDECEQTISVPIFSSVSPTNPLPGTPIYVQVAFNEVVPMASVWANGISLTRTQSFSVPFWVGTIPADTRPGPQTVYFLGKDQIGGLSSYIATYTVQAPPAPTNVFINEWVADNASGLRDEDNETQDWFELYNGGASSADLSLCYLTDNLADHTKWRLPSGVILPPGGFLVIFASSKDRRGSPLHTNFRFANAGEAIGLFAADGVTPIDQITFGQQQTDVSEGRWPDGAPNIQRLTVPSPGSPNLCLPVITTVFPTTGRMGDIITITGSGFGSNAASLCSMVMGGVSVPMRVLSAIDTRITARIGTVPPDAQPGPIMLTPGQGSTAPFTPAFSNIVVWDNWTWHSAQTGALSSTIFTPVYVPPDDGQRWFHSTLTNGVLCVYLSGNWGADARVTVELHLKAGGRWYDMQPRTLLAGSGTTLQCATLIKDIIVCDLQQNQGVLLPADVTDLGNGVVKVTIRAPNSQPITMGSLTICTTPPRVPVITCVIPDRAAAGDTIRIIGRGFGNNPDNVCAMLASPLPGGGAAIWDPIRVLTATDEQITARVGTVPPPMSGMPAPRLMVQIGDGNSGPITPAFPQILGGEDIWVWSSREAAAVFPSNFTTVYVPPPTNRQYFYATVTNGVICVYLSGDWPSNSQVTVETHFNAGGVHYDMQERTVTFAGGGTTLDCAQLIKDLLVCAFGQRGGVLLPADIVQVAPGLVKLTVRSPNNQPITSGLLVICRSAPPPPPNRRWLPLLGASAPGTPGTMSVLGNTPSNTSLRVTIPGVWLTTEMYGDRPFTRIELPPVQLGGAGFPATPTQRGWYDFPAETGYPPLDPMPYRTGLDIGVPVSDFPESALGHHPTNERDMMALGIDPAGARPGIPAVRGFVAVSSASGSNDVGVQINAQSGVTMTLSDPPIPAGFDGPDNAARLAGFTAPQLVDLEFYASFTGLYQGVETIVSPITRAGPFAAAEIRLPLVQVLNPSVIRILTNYVVLVKHLKGTEDFTCPIPWDSWIFKIPFINGQAIRDALTVKGIKIQASRSAHYLILTPRVYRADLNEFALWKQAKGLNVDFAYVGNAPTDDVAANRTAIDAYLENYFQQHYCNGVYVLIIGDVDVIPSGRSTRVIETPDLADADSDHVYEVLGSDRFPSLYVGRLSINTSDELKNQLRKILSYERSPVAGDWPTRATLAANSQTEGGCYGVCAAFPSKYAKAVEDIASYGSYTMPPTFQKLHAGAASMAVTRAVNQDVVDAVNAGRGQVLYRGHGGGTAWVSGWDGSGAGSGASFSQGTHLPLLNNTAYPIVYSIACQNARLRNTECIAESWMLSSNGAVAHFGASVDSKTTENHERAKGIFRAIYESGFTRLAPALGEAERISYNVTGGGGSWDNNTFCYLLLGDPELTLRRKQVFNFRLVASNVVFGAGSKITVRGASNAPVALTLVNVRLSSGGSVNGFTGADGSLVLSNVPPSMIAGLDLHADGYPSETAPMGPVLRVLGYSLTGGFMFRVEGSPGAYLIQRSTDLANWGGIGTVTITGSFADFTDPTVGQRRSAFYRAVGSP